MRLAAAFLAILMCAVVPLLLPPQSPNNSDPCDAYGNCIGSSIAYTRSNPDATLYLGDSFVITPSWSLGPNTRAYSLSWSFDSAVLSPVGGGAFQLIANVSRTYSVTVTANFTVVLPVGNSTITLLSSLSTSQTISARAFLLSIHTQLGNVTNSAHQVLRNPDGSFYHSDEFIINYTYDFLFMQQRPDISAFVEPKFDPNFAKLTTYQNSSSTGYFLFAIANRSGTSEITVTAQVFNYQSALLGSKTEKQPFAVVNYSPFFTHFTYMQYNSRNASAYERPFVTLVRYDGNNPGYSYGGDINTGQIIGLNDTRERALVNSFNFTTAAWGVKANLNSSDVSQDLSFWNQTSVDLDTRTTNATFPVLTFAHRMVKFYYTSDVAKIQENAARGLEYFNVTERVISKGFAGGNYSVLSTSYLYEPIYYSGYLTMFTYGPSGLDSSTSVNMTLVTPNPLNPHLLASLNKTFGHYPGVVHDFRNDLFPAYSYVMNLKPVSSSGGRWVFLLNDTNLAMTNETQMPTLYITVQGLSGSYSYSVPVAFSSFAINRDILPSLPFPRVVGYYLDQERQLIALPVNYSFTSTSPFVSWDYGNGGAQSFISPVSFEPGNLSRIYGFPYGRNTTIYANLDGGGGSLVNIRRDQTTFRAMVMLGPQTGGAKILWVKDPNGNVIVNDTLVPDTEPPSPRGYYGFHAISFPMSVNGTYQFGITNSWGVISTFQTYDNIAHLPAPPNGEYFLMTFFGFLVVGLYFFGKIARRTRT